MANKQGKVISIPVTNPKIGMQVLYKNGEDGKELVLDTINRIDVEFNGFKDLVVLKNMHLLPLDPLDLKQLVLEYWSEEIQGYKHGYVTIPLKFSQWKTAVDNGEVDSDKVVEFELRPDIGSCSEYAKIIPAKKKHYTEEEVLSIIKKSKENFYKDKITTFILKEWLEQDNTRYSSAQQHH